MGGGAKGEGAADSPLNKWATELELEPTSEGELSQDSEIMIWASRAEVKHFIDWATKASLNS